MIVAGIDPGKGGALAILMPDGTAQILDVPVMKKGKGSKTVPAWSLWSREWCMALDLIGPDMVVIEDVSARTGQGVTSMFSFGRALGFAHGLVAAVTSCPVHHPSASVWKAKMGLINADKNASINKALSLYPALGPQLTRVKDDGRAEAVLLAHFGRHFLAGSE